MNMLRLIHLLFCAFISLNSLAQLQRKPLLGARIEYVSENGNSVCKVVQVVRGTSVELKLQEKDIITKIGEKTFTSADEFITQFLSFEPGKEIQLSVLRGKKNLTLKAKVVARPYETDDNATVIYDEANYKGGQLRVIINKPFKENKMPAMLFIPGYTCSSID